MSELQQIKDAGRPATTTTKCNIKKISDLLKKDSRFNVIQLAQFTNMSLSQVYYILKEHLKLKKINEPWIPQFADK